MSTPSPTSPPSSSAPPPSNATSPPPPSSSPPSNSTSPPPASPPPSTPSAPPPSTPSIPSAPPPSTPSTPSAPPPSTPSIPSAPPPSTPSKPSPPPSSTPSTPSAPPPSSPSTPPHSVPPTRKSPPVPPPSNSTTPSAPSPPAPRGGSPPSASKDSSKVSISTGAAAGIAIGAAAILVVLCFLFVCCRKKKRRRADSPPLDYYGGGPPPMPHQKDDRFGTQPQHWQHNAPLPPAADHLMKLPPQPPVRPSYASRPPQFPPPPPPNFSSGSGSYQSGSEPLPPLNPKYTPGYAKSTFTYEELAIATNGFSDYNLLGQGGFGYVHKGVLPNGKEVAIKQLKAGSGQGEREFQAEVEIISRVHHRHLVSLVGYCISGDHRLLVYEYVSNKTLEFHLHGKDVPPMDWPTRLKIALGSAKGLAYLHEDCHPKIIHRDIKAANILLEMNFEAKVADFGLAKFTVENNTHVSTRVMGTFGYLAPEYASSGKLSDKSDVFSFGVMLLELITGKRPVDATQTYTDDSLVDWARPLLQKAMEHDDYDELIDRRLGDKYNHDEMARMVACAASCVRHSARRRPKMSQVVRALEGHVSLEALNEGIRPGHSTADGSTYGSSDYDTMQYHEDLKKFRNIALASRDFTSSEYSVPTSEYGQIQSASSGEDKQAREIGKEKKNDYSS